MQRERRSQPHWLTNNEEYTSRVIRLLCSESGACVDFGQHQDIIAKYFNNFNIAGNPYYKQCSRIGGVSANGIVFEVEFERDSYKAYVIFKMAITKSADNLMYEMLAGRNLINWYVNIFPCFTETYKFYKFRSEDKKRKLVDIAKKNKKNIQLSDFIVDANDQINVEEICQNNELFGISIQHFLNFQSIYSMTSNANQVRRYAFELPGILFQGYFALDCLSENFTHYDLHVENYGSYMPFQNKFILLHFMNKDKTEFVFPTQYIAKIIDYGRCFYSNNLMPKPPASKPETIQSSFNPSVNERQYSLFESLFSVFHKQPIEDSTSVAKKICKNASCVPSCGEDYGLGVLTGSITEKATDPTSQFYWINPTVKNESHDLRVLNMVSPALKRFNSMGPIQYTSPYGTPEDTSTPYDPSTRIVRNVSDARKMLQNVIIEEHIPQVLLGYYTTRNIEKAGDLYVYSDGRPYEWVVEH